MLTLHDPHSFWSWGCCRPLEAYYFLRSFVRTRVRAVTKTELESINRGDCRYEQLPYVAAAVSRNYARRIYYNHLRKEQRA